MRKELRDAAPVLRAILDVPEERRMDAVAVALHVWFALLAGRVEWPGSTCSEGRTEG